MPNRNGWAGSSALLTVCDIPGLIGREMLATDSIKLPSIASKAKSGSRANFECQAELSSVDFSWACSVLVHGLIQVKILLEK